MALIIQDIIKKKESLCNASICIVTISLTPRQII